MSNQQKQKNKVAATKIKLNISKMNEKNVNIKFIKAKIFDDFMSFHILVQVPACTETINFE